MWTEYKKRFLTSQLVIVFAVIMGWQFFKMPGKQLVAIVIAMEIGALIGAALGAKLKNQMKRAEDELPLKPPS